MSRQNQRSRCPPILELRWIRTHLKSIESIAWPADAIVAVHSYLEYVVNVLAELNFDFPRQFIDFPWEIMDPIHAGQKYIDAQSPADELSAARRFWSEYMLAHLAQQNHVALIVRLPLGLLPAPELITRQVSGEYLCCFLESLQHIGEDDKRAEVMLQSYFTFSK